CRFRCAVGCIDGAAEVKIGCSEAEAARRRLVDRDQGRAGVDHTRNRLAVDPEIRGIVALPVGREPDIAMLINFSWLLLRQRNIQSGCLSAQSGRALLKEGWHLGGNGGNDTGKNKNAHEHQQESFLYEPPLHARRDDALILSPRLLTSC